MEQYGKILLYAMPAFLFLVLFEKWYGIRKGKDTVLTMDMISSLSSGITNITKDVLAIYITILTYEKLVSIVAIVHIQATWLTYVVAFIVIDLAGYLVHLIDHKFNFFWNSHLIHHSSEEFNLACALRQSVSVFVRLFVIFLLPAAVLGVPPEVIALVAPLHLFAQFWYHTQHIGKMGFLEKIIVTPSHHRVHHAINKEYLDKNMGQILIIWDKMFGTFQEELQDVKPVYGITRPVRTWNPIKINFQHIWLLFTDALFTKNWWDKIRIWFMPTGWRPADVAAKYPVYKIEDVNHFEKYKAGNSTTLLQWWSGIQLFILLLLVSYLFARLTYIGNPAIFLYGAFVFLFVYALTELMDGNRFAIVWEVLKNAIGIALIFLFKDWFGSDALYPAIKYLLLEYFALSSFIAFWVYQKSYKQSSDQMQLTK
jgi:sterol desaturase/sphingolipid hydroxylase (fatty acid hydroxylase superfamily)